MSRQFAKEHADLEMLPVGLDQWISQGLPWLFVTGERHVQELEALRKVFKVMSDEARIGDGGGQCARAG